jgi:hypothetical protein
MADEGVARARKKKKLAWRPWLRALHRDAGYLVVGLTVVYAVSGLAVNHIDDWNANYVEYERLHQLGPLPDDDEEAAALVTGRLGIEEAHRDLPGRRRRARDPLRRPHPHGAARQRRGPRRRARRPLLRSRRQLAPSQPRQGRLDLHRRRLRRAAPVPRARRHVHDPGAKGAPRPRRRPGGPRGGGARSPTWRSPAVPDPRDVSWHSGHATYVCDAWLRIGTMARASDSPRTPAPSFRTRVRLYVAILAGFFGLFRGQPARSRSRSCPSTCSPIRRACASGRGRASGSWWA